MPVYNPHPVWLRRPWRRLGLTQKGSPLDISRLRRSLECINRVVQRRGSRKGLPVGAVDSLLPVCPRSDRNPD